MTTAVEQRTAAADPASTFEAVLLPSVRRHAAVAFRHLRADAREEATAEAVALAWSWYLRLIQRGKDVRRFPSAVATFAARQVKCGRRLCGQEAGKDVLSPLAQRRHGFRVEPLTAAVRRDRDALHGRPHGQRELDAVEERLRDNTHSPVPDQVTCRVDFPRWLTRLRARARRLARDLALDHSTRDLAARHGVSQGRISQLRRELHADWRRFHGEPVG